MIHRFLFILFITVSGFVNGQSVQYVQYSGTIITSGNDSIEPVPFVRIRNLSRNTKAISNIEGFFSLVVERGDTIEFSSMGFENSKYIVPNNITGNKFFSNHILIRDYKTLDPIMIVPWKNIDELKKAFVDLELNEDDMVRAYQNMQLERWASLQKSTPYDGQAMQSIGVKEQSNYNQNRTVQPVQNIFNPIAWASFLDQLKKGKSKKKTDE